MIPAQEALERLKQGNRRFMSMVHDAQVDVSPQRTLQLLKNQAPFAIIL